ncbi:MAG: DUF948 domain-containing protein [Deltaproteobacteria bacterium]|nr:DUF948 domain-containing protein [Deltaproteobacteria bacterium]
MTFSANIYEISVLLIAVAFVILVVAMIPALLQTKRTIKAFEDLTLESKRTVESVNQIIKKAGERAEDIDDVVKQATEVSRKVVGLADSVVDTVKLPLITLISTVIGAEHGFRSFFRRRKEEKEEGGGDDVNR